MKRFCNTIADYVGAQRAMRFLLQRPPFNMHADRANTYTLHGFRHIYTTAMRQLNFPTDQINDAGHWRQGSGMPRVYDAAEATAELTTKDRVRCAVAAGWRRSSAGCLPAPSPVPLPAPPTPGPVALGPVPATPKGAWAPLVSEGGSKSSSSSTAPCISTASSSAVPVKVINMSTQVLHTWLPIQTGGGITVYTVCRNMKCGHPLAPARHATFETQARLQEVHFNLCPVCFGK